MQNAKISGEIQRIRSLIKRAQKSCGDDIELSSHWAKYLCLLSSGFLENSIKEIYGDFSRSAASEPVARFAQTQLSSINNPNDERFIKVAKTFKASWGIDLEAFMNENGRKEAINSIIGQRHLIAHGREKDAEITLVRIADYFERSIEVMEFIESQCAK